MAETTSVEQPQEDEQGHPLIWSIAALCLLVAIAVAGYKYREFQRNSIITTAPLDSACLLNTGTCRTVLDGGLSAEIAITPLPIYSATPMQVALQLTSTAEDILGVEIHFRGESMNMGLNQFTLQSQQEGRYGGEVILPVCVRNSMMWIAEVQVATGRGKLAIPFRFESRHP